MIYNDGDSQFVNIAVQGCCHGELDSIYKSISDTEASTQQVVDLLIICGDMQCIRHNQDLESLAVPSKYRRLNTFHQYVTGEKVAPVLTIFIGGNHEASNLLQSLYYGGFVAPNIYYMGFAGVVRFRGLRIGGLSGIYNDRHYQLGHFEIPPYSQETMRSVYHLRELEIYRMMHLKENICTDPLNIFLSHDWPSDVWNHGDCEALLRIKPYFREDIRSGKLGSPPLRRIMNALMPDFWFAAHLHVKFAAVVAHSPIVDEQICPTRVNPEEIELDLDIDQNSIPISNDVSVVKTTRFLALDKVIPGRGYLQFLQIPSKVTSLCHDTDLHFDLEWMNILYSTHDLLVTTHGKCPLPSRLMTLTSQDFIESCLKLEFGEDMCIPNIQPVPEFLKCTTNPFREGNHQTDRLLKALQLEHVWTISAQSNIHSAPVLSIPHSSPLDLLPSRVSLLPSSFVNTVKDPNEIEI